MESTILCHFLFRGDQPGKGFFTKTMLVMKLTTIFLLVGALQESAGGNAQTVTYSAKSVKLQTVFSAIEVQTGYHFFYRKEDLKDSKPISVQFKATNFITALETLFLGQPLRFEIQGNTVFITKKGKPSQPIFSDVGSPVLAPLPPSIDVTVVVQNTDGLPLEGASIRLKGTLRGVTTDANGYAVLKAIPPNSTLVISFTGYGDKEVAIGNSKIINVRLAVLSKNLDDIIVVGYGTQKKVALTGAISSINGKELGKSSAATLDNALAGAMPGLTSIQSGGGQPGMDDATLYLRGAATLNGTSPLILIDGVPRTDIRVIDPNEVASISILKDASATALFGVRGANGVILITTRRGTSGQSHLSVNVRQSYTSFTEEPERLHSWDYLRLRNEALENDGNAAEYPDSVIAKYKNPLAGLSPSDPNYASKATLLNYIYPDHDYYKEFIKKYTPQTRINVNMEGGDNKLKYFLNIGFLNQGGNLNTEPKSQLGYDPAARNFRWTFRSNLDYKMSNSLSLFLNLGSYFERVNMPNTSKLFGGSSGSMMNDLLYEAKSILPITPGPTTIAGYGVKAGEMVDPVNLDRSAFEEMNRSGYRSDSRSNLNSTVGLNWDLSKLIQGLSMKGMASYDVYGGSTTEGATTGELYLADVDYTTNTLSYTTSRDVATPISISRTTLTYYNINLQGSVNYQRKFGKHEVGGMVVAQRDFWDHGAEIPHNVVGLAGRVTYDYDNRYFLEFDMGYNGSEQFAPSKRFGFFPAISGGWVVSNEQFLKGSQIVTYLKLSGSYGKVGNDQMGSNRFLYLDNNTVVSGGLGSLGNGTYISEGIIGNKYLTWETSKKKNIGIDFGLFKDLKGSFDYFTEHRTGILITRQTVPTFQGIYLSNVPLQNMGVVDNHGYEIELTYNKSVSKDFSFTIKGNYSYNHNMVKNDDEVKRDNTYAYPTRTEGHSLGQSWGYQIDWKDHGGYWISTDEIKASNLTYDFGIPRVGDFKYVDVNHDGVINDKDMVPIGYPSIPRINYGITLTTNYKAFDITILISGVSQYSTYRAGAGIFENANMGIYYDYQRNAWTLDRYLKGEKITYPALSANTTTNHNHNDFFIMNRAFTRLKTLELGYTLPKRTLKAAGISDVRIFVSGQNLFLWQHQRIKHLDPENDSPIGYPITKDMSFGVNINF
jgi:TonB-linked SusC/RagA family outer membrane protein